MQALLAEDIFKVMKEKEPLPIDIMKESIVDSVIMHTYDAMKELYKNEVIALCLELSQKADNPIAAEAYLNVIEKLK